MAELEAALRKDPRTSSTPPSSDGPVAPHVIGYQHLPSRGARGTLADLPGLRMSTGTLATVLATTRNVLRRFLALVHHQIAAAPVARFNETVLRVPGSGEWVDLTSTATLSLFTVRSCPGHAAMAEVGVLPEFAGIAVHDGAIADHLSKPPRRDRSIAIIPEFLPIRPWKRIVGQRQ